MDPTRLCVSDIVCKDFWEELVKKEANMTSVGENQVRAYSFYANWKN